MSMRHKDEKKEQAVVAAAITLINERGFSEVSIAKIAKEAGVSPATIYIYYENKEDMLNKIYISLKTEMSEALLRGVDTQGNIETGTKQMLRNIYQFALAKPGHFAFCEQFANSPLIEKITMEEAMSSFRPVREVFERGVTRGILKDIPFEVISAFSYQPMIFLAKQQLSGKAEVTGSVFEEAVDLAWDVISAE